MIDSITGGGFVAVTGGETGPTGAGDIGELPHEPLNTAAASSTTTPERRPKVFTCLSTPVFAATPSRAPRG